MWWVLCHLCQGDVVGTSITVTHQPYTPSKYYCRTISTSSFRDEVSKHQQNALLGITIVPSVIVSIPPEDLSAKVQELSQLYASDLPSSDTVGSWNDENSITNMKKSVYPRVQHSLSVKLAQCSPTLTFFYCTLPSNILLCWEIFSELKRIITPFRSAMTTARLCLCSMCHSCRYLSSYRARCHNADGGDSWRPRWWSLLFFVELVL